MISICYESANKNDRNWCVVLRCVAERKEWGERDTQKIKQKQWEWANCSRCLCLYNNKYSSFNTSYEIDLNGRLCTSSIHFGGCCCCGRCQSGFSCQITALCTYFIYNVNLIGALTKHIYLALYEIWSWETKWARSELKWKWKWGKKERKKKRKRGNRENRAQTIQQVLYLEEINSIICAAITAPYML